MKQIPYVVSRELRSQLEGSIVNLLRVEKTMRALLLLFLTAPAANAQTFLSYNTLGITHHGQNVNDELSENMPYRITDDGKTVFHPTEHLLKIDTDNKVITTGYLRDCFDQKSWILLAGPAWRPGTNWTLSLLVGGYVRDTFHFIDNEGNSATPADQSLVLDLGGNKQFVPFFLASVTKRWFLFEYAGIEVNIGSNLLITHATTGVFVDL